ncbi:MAG: type II secretion system inner membrane protein GspF [Deltaproteobacteria bacterium]|nr:type II secretion system inner membrane protein GspF [Deltaproteobacteria bacterium]MBW1921865.1 type II secretion system inner membrane protein GspF [Deltaproteobacteria bacterium]MBW1948028.1 type II secretion system inner membrane protein GspF [Deltaproteobacteria bacterium]MBW2006937.1 type II secretion system inner membrane protein GspF [Deltaproteobacteria bacterium]MBW2103652.1 type II secretion system inner membrane protein GspF [Deltaproteobacteria bacterium]
MPVFEYKAYDKRGKRVSGIITAEGPSAARARLIRDRIFPREIKEVREVVGRSFFGRFLAGFHGLKRVDAAEVSAALRQLATLVSSGLPLVECLTALIEQTDQAQLKRIFTQIREKVVEGQSLSRAMAEHTEVFNPIFINMVRAAEQGGALDIILKRLAEFSEKSIKLKKKISAAMTYPVLLTLISTIILIFLMTFVMPKVVAIFRGAELALPWATRALIWITDELKRSWWLLGLTTAAVVAGISAWLRTDQGGWIWDRIRLKAPLFGRLHHRGAVARFTRTLAILLKSGLPLVQALETARLSAGNRVIEEAVSKTAQRIGEGSDFAAPLKSTGVFPPLVVQLVRAGEQSGELEEMLEKAAEVYEDDVEATIASLTSVLEPGIILMMGFVVAFIVMAILLPIFDMTGGVR